MKMNAMTVNAMIVAAIMCACMAAVNANPCADLPDGSVPEYACRAYTLCQGGAPVDKECNATQAYNTDINTCDDIDNVPAPCGNWRDCSGKPDRRYVDVANYGCDAYYTCHNEYYYGFNFCPSGLVYHESLQLCNWPASVPPPCGTANS